jgi:hypothetical protein
MGMADNAVHMGSEGNSLGTGAAEGSLEAEDEALEEVADEVAAAVVVAGEGGLEDPVLDEARSEVTVS